jgi:hypothetical protein
VVLRGGTYAGDLTISGTDVFLIADGFAENAVAIDGSVTVTGEIVRRRGLAITGDLVANGPHFGMSLSTVKGNASIGGTSNVLLRNVLCGPADVSTSNAPLLDNFGLEPTPTAPMGACD